MKRFELGARVHEPTYGPGSVIAVEDAYTRIQFDDNTVRKFLTSLATLEPTSEPAPTVRPRTRKRKTASASAAKSTKATKSTAPAKTDADADSASAAKPRKRRSQWRQPRRC